MTTISDLAPEYFSVKNSKIGTRNDIRLIRLILMLGCLALVQPLFAAALAPQPPVELTGTHGKFDFIKVDAANRRLLACHTGNNSLDVIDLATSKLLKSIPTGAAQGVAIDEKGGRYFVSCSKPAQLVIIDAVKLEATGTVSLPGPADLCAYCAGGVVVVDNDEKPEQWCVYVPSKRIDNTKIFASTGLEDLAWSPDLGFLIQNLKDSSQINVRAHPYALAAGVYEFNYSTLPAEKPHGLAMMGSDNVFIAGGNGKLVLLNYRTGKVISSANIAPRVDEIAYDPGNSNVYCASGTGVISVVHTGHDAESIPSAQGAHSITVDPNTHTVWIVFAKNEKAYVQSFLAGKN